MPNSVNFQAAFAQAMFQSERQKEMFESLKARRGEATGNALRRISELIWLIQQTSPPLDIVQNDPEAVHAILGRLKESMLNTAAHIIEGWLTQTEGRRLCDAEVESIFMPEIDAIIRSLYDSQDSIYFAGGIEP